MIFCGKCGAEIKEGVKFCSVCGAPVGEGVKQETVNVVDTTSDYEPEDIKRGKFMSVASYCALSLITYFGVPEYKFARYHAKQAFPVFILYVWALIVTIGLSFIPTVSYDYWGFYRVNAWAFIVPIIDIIFWAIPVVLAVFGIINALKGKAKELPLIGKIKILP